MSDKIKVVISFDAEFSINGAFADPTKNRPCADGIFKPNSNGSEGLPDILNILSKHNVMTTFFTEALQSNYFGTEKMQHYVQQMRSKNQEVQLHTHPCWTVFKNENWTKDVVGKKVKDDFKGLSTAEIVNTLKESISAFKAWGLPSPNSFRAGNLAASRNLYKALAELNFSAASNIGLPISSPDEDELQIHNEATYIDGVLEIPVTSYKSMGIRDKALTITGCSFLEMKSVLKQCKKQNIAQVVILTHIHEFIKPPLKTGKVKKNQINLTRLDNLCRFINKSDDFEFNTFGQLASDIKVNNETCRGKKIPNSSLLSGLWTILQNQTNDRI